MNDSFQPLPQLKIATPCPKSWEKMTGDEQSRFCSHCEKSVFNFTEMTSSEVQEVLESNESVCARMRRRKDGSIVTRDCQPQPCVVKTDAINRRDWISQVFSLASMVLAMATLVGCKRNAPAETMGELVAPESGEIIGKANVLLEEMGDVAVMPETLGEVYVPNEDLTPPLVGRVAAPKAPPTAQ